MLSRKSTRKYSYDNDGNRVTYTYEIFQPDLGYTEVEEVWKYTYDSKGNIVKEEMGDDNDGEFDEDWSYTYNADGNILSKEVDGDDDCDDCEINDENIHNLVYLYLEIVILHKFRCISLNGCSGAKFIFAGHYE